MRPQTRSAESGPVSGEPRPLRSDARRNRERVLSAADAVFAEHGPLAPTEEVARRAGLAIGTVFRHFPTKEKLIEAVIAGRIEKLTVDARELLGASDAGVALVTFFHRWIDQSATKYQFAGALMQAGMEAHEASGADPHLVEALHDAVSALVERAQHEGAVREDVTAPDVVGLLVGAARAIEHVGPMPEPRRRVLSVILDGLRPGDPAQAV